MLDSYPSPILARLARLDRGERTTHTIISNPKPISQVARCHNATIRNVASDLAPDRTAPDLRNVAPDLDVLEHPVCGDGGDHPMQGKRFLAGVNHKRPLEIEVLQRSSQRAGQSR